MTIINDFLRSVGIFFDSLVYGLIGSLYELFMDISATQVFANGTIASFANRVYALLAIFMLFRLSFSFLTYIITPDAASDKNSGAGKLIGNILMTIVLLISVPWLFTQALQIQNDLLRDNIVGKIILGAKSTDVTSQMQAGDTMAWETFSAFFYPREDICESGLSDQGACIGKLNGKIAGEEIEVSEMGLGDAYERIANAKSVKGISKNGLVNIKDANEEYVFEYTGFISLIAGGFVAYILLLFSIQIAVRTIKLGVLQLIAPIPIISYLDPKQGKDGMFKKWLKNCGKTFADLFIRLAAIYFAIFIVTEITKGGGLQNTLTGGKTGGFAKVLIILGALTFAKDLPKFIEEITGIKLDGGFSLNPMKNAAIGGLIGGAVGAGMGLAGAATGAGVGGIFTGAARGLTSGFGGKKFGDITSSQSSRNAQMRTARLNGSTFGGRMGARLGSTFGLPTESQRIDAQINGIDEQIKDIDNSLKPTRDSIADRKSYTDKVKAMEDRAESKIKNGEAGDISLRYKELENRASELRDRLGRGEEGVSARDVANAEMAALNYLNDEAKYQYIDDVVAGTRSDSAMLGMQNDLLSMAATSQTYTAADGSTVTIDVDAVNAGAASRHSHAGRVTGTVNDDTRNIINPAETRKQGLEQEKARLYEDQRRAKSNESAVKK